MEASSPTHSREILGPGNSIWVPDPDFLWVPATIMRLLPDGDQGSWSGRRCKKIEVKKLVLTQRPDERSGDRQEKWPKMEVEADVAPCSPWGEERDTLVVDDMFKLVGLPAEADLLDLPPCDSDSRELFKMSHGSEERSWSFTESLDSVVVSDMCDLQSLNLPSALCLLRARFHRGHVYTDAGETLIAMNPYKALDIYGEESLRRYCGLRGKSEARLPPHAYRVAHSVYTKIQRGASPQTIVISGDSGSGKTETLQILIKAFVWMSKKNSITRDTSRVIFQPSNGDESVERQVGEKREDGLGITEDAPANTSPVLCREGESSGGRSPDRSLSGKSKDDEHSADNDTCHEATTMASRVLDSSILLEAFGNASTIANSNSSRFGRFLLLQFERTGSVKPLGPAESSSSAVSSTGNLQLMGSKASVYLLEKSRVVNVESGQKNFHVFYLLFSLAEDERARRFGLAGGPADYSYLTPKETPERLSEWLKERRVCSGRDGHGSVLALDGRIPLRITPPSSTVDKQGAAMSPSVRYSTIHDHLDQDWANGEGEALQKEGLKSPDLNGGSQGAEGLREFGEATARTGDQAGFSNSEQTPHCETRHNRPAKVGEGVRNRRNLLSMVTDQMKVVSIKPEEQEEIFRTLAAILHLGELQFGYGNGNLYSESRCGGPSENEHENFEEDSVLLRSHERLPGKVAIESWGGEDDADVDTGTSRVINRRRLCLVAQLLGTISEMATDRSPAKCPADGDISKGFAVNPIAEHLDCESERIHGSSGSSPSNAILLDQLQQSLCFRSITVGMAESYSIPVGPERAKATVDSLAKALYERLFFYVVSRLNMATAGNFGDTRGTSFNECDLEDNSAWKRETENTHVPIAVEKSNAGRKNELREKPRATEDRPDSAKVPEQVSIGLLDIFGFEVFPENGIEQLLINYTNEKLQELYNNSMIVSVMSEYREEGLLGDMWLSNRVLNSKSAETERSGFNERRNDSLVEGLLVGDVQGENTATLDLLEGPMGVLNILNEACLLPSGGSLSPSSFCAAAASPSSFSAAASSPTKCAPSPFQIFLSRLYSAQNDHPSLSTPRPPLGARGGFVVKHFAGKVEYTAKYMVESSREVEPWSQLRLFSNSKLNVVRRICGPEQARQLLENNEGQRVSSSAPDGQETTNGKPGGGVSVTCETNTRDTRISSSRGRAKPWQKRRRRSSLALESVGTQFRAQLHQLVALLQQHDTHYIRCMKPNDRKLWNVWDGERVADQFRYSGVLQAVYFSRQGYRQRISILKFLAKYSCLKALFPKEFLEPPPSKAVAFAVAEDNDGSLGEQRRIAIELLCKFFTLILPGVVAWVVEDETICMRTKHVCEIDSDGSESAGLTAVAAEGQARSQAPRTSQEKPVVLVGKTKIFFLDGVLEDLECRRAQVIAAYSRRILSLFLVIRAQRELRRRKLAVKRIQQNIREFSHKRVKERQQRQQQLLLQVAIMEENRIMSVEESLSCQLAGLERQQCLEALHMNAEEERSRQISGRFLAEGIGHLATDGDANGDLSNQEGKEVHGGIIVATALSETHPNIELDSFEDICPDGNGALSAFTHSSDATAWSGDTAKMQRQPCALDNEDEVYRQDQILSPITEGPACQTSSTASRNVQVDGVSSHHASLQCHVDTNISASSKHFSWTSASDSENHWERVTFQELCGALGPLEVHIYYQNKPLWIEKGVLTLFKGEISDSLDTGGNGSSASAGDFVENRARDRDVHSDEFQNVGLRHHKSCHDAFKTRTDALEGGQNHMYVDNSLCSSNSSAKVSDGFRNGMVFYVNHVHREAILGHKHSSWVAGSDKIPAEKPGNFPEKNVSIDGNLYVVLKSRITGAELVDRGIFRKRIVASKRYRRSWKDRNVFILEPYFKYHGCGSDLQEHTLGDSCNVCRDRFILRHKVSNRLACVQENGRITLLESSKLSAIGQPPVINPTQEVRDFQIVHDGIPCGWSEGQKLADSWTPDNAVVTEDVSSTDSTVHRQSMTINGNEGGEGKQKTLDSEVAEIIQQTDNPVETVSRKHIHRMKPFSGKIAKNTWETMKGNVRVHSNGDVARSLENATEDQWESRGCTSLLVCELRRLKSYETYTIHLHDSRNDSTAQNRSSSSDYSGTGNRRKWLYSVFKNTLNRRHKEPKESTRSDTRAREDSGPKTSQLGLALDWSEALRVTAIRTATVNENPSEIERCGLVHLGDRLTHLNSNEIDLQCDREFLLQSLRRRPIDLTFRTAEYRLCCIIRTVEILTEPNPCAERAQIGYLFPGQIIEYSVRRSTSQSSRN